MEEGFRDEIDKRFIYEQLMGFIYRLPFREQEILYLRYWEELTYKDIGEILGICGQRVSHLVYKIIRKLRHPVCSKHLYKVMYGKIDQEYKATIEKGNEDHRIRCFKKSEERYRRSLKIGEERKARIKKEAFFRMLEFCKSINKRPPKPPSEGCTLLYWEGTWCVGSPVLRFIVVNDETYYRWLQWLLEDYLSRHPEYLK